MNSNHSPWGFSADTQANLDLLHTVLDSQDAYVWNPSATSSEAYLSDLESTWDKAGLSSETAAIGWQSMANQLDIMWQSFDQAADADAESTVLGALQERFASRMPVDLLAQVAQRAEEIVRSGQPMMQQLMHCVQDVLSAWDEADLQIMARPLALAMRDGQGEMLDVALKSVREADWTTLSAMEQARLGLAIARYALDQVEQ